MLPVTLTLGLINVNGVIDTVFASRFYPELGPTAINSAFRLYMLPQGMFSVAVATVLFPALARLAARDDLDGFRATISTGLRQIAFLLIPAAIVSAVLAKPIVRLVYERGAFTESDVTVVAGCLAAFSLGLVFNGWMLMLTRGFYGLQSNWVPTTIAVGTLSAERRPRRRALPARGLGDPVRDVARQHRRGRGPRVLPPAPRRRDRPGPHLERGGAHHGGVRCPRCR